MTSLENQVASQNRCYVNSEVRNPGNSGPPGSGCPDMTALRVLLAVVLGAGSAAAETVEVEPWQPPPRATTKSPGIKGVDAAGIVIDPGRHPDGQRWPYGMWIPTPDIGDDNVLVPGTNALSDGAVSSALSARISRGIDQGVEGLLKWLLPPPKLLRKP
jgi:hypothetical protein